MTHVKTTKEYNYNYVLLILQLLKLIYPWCHCTFPIYQIFCFSPKYKMGDRKNDKNGT